MKSAEELKHWVSLWRVSGVGSKNFQKLLAAFNSPEAVFNASSDSLKKAGISDSLAKSIYSFKKDSEQGGASSQLLMASAQATQEAGKALP